jgi:hypothetical protein
MSPFKSSVYRISPCGADSLSVNNIPPYLNARRAFGVSRQLFSNKYVGQATATNQHEHKYGSDGLIQQEPLYKAK